MVNWLQFVANGAAVGSIILLGAVGLSLLYGVKRFANFAHGDLMTLGAYAAFTLAAQMRLGMVAGILAALVVVPLVGALLEWGVFDRLRARPPVVALIASVGLSFVIQNLVRVIWGTQDKAFPLLAETAIPLGFGVSLTPSKILVILLAAAIAVGLHLLLTRTILGKALRATSDNYDLARVSGIPTRRVEYTAWALSAGLAATGGVALGVLTFLNPNMGFNQLLLIFAAVILGGIGSAYGAMLGAMVIGVALEVSKPVLTAVGVADTLSLAVAFVIMVAVLLLRPEGLVGRNGDGGWIARLRRGRGSADV